ncbi:MAG: hypothetical protein HYS66_13930, partial [Deltaproteobacteria bacterium]|nr:hypothetical protein [Deltaproteobacteria bacterium]
MLQVNSSDRSSSASAIGTPDQVTLRDDVWIPSVCKMCGNGCGTLIHRVDGVVVKI